MERKNKHRFFQDGTSHQMARRYWRIMAPAMLAIGVIVGLEVAWLSGNWLLLPPFSIGISLIAFALARIFARDIRPTVTCRACGAHGWIADLASTGGTCSYCSCEQFNYARWYVKGPNIPYKITHSDVGGMELLTLRSQNDLKYI